MTSAKEAPATPASVRAGGLPGRANCLGVATSAVIFGSFSVLLGQDVNWDLRNYHYYNPFAFLQNRLGFDYGPAQLQTYLNPLLDLPFFLLIESVKPVRFGFLLGALQGTNFWLVFLIAYRLIAGARPAERVAITAVCAATGMAGAVTLSQLGSTFHDLTVSAFALGAILILVRGAASLTAPGGRLSGRAAVAAGVVLGLGIGLKPTLTVYAIGITAALPLLVIGSGGYKAVLGGWTMGLVLGVLGTGGYWMLEMWQRFGNPVFPFYNAVFRSPYFEPVNFRTRYLPWTIGETLFYPFYFHIGRTTSLELPFQDFRLAIAYVLLVVVVAVAAARGLNRRWTAGAWSLRLGQPAPAFVITALVTSYVVWQVQFSLYRYAAPHEHLSPLVIYLLLSRLIRHGALRLVAFVLLCITIVATVRPPETPRLPWKRTFFGVRPPDVPEPHRAIVLMTSMAPTAYVIPAFPPAARFVRLHSNFFTPFSRTRLAGEIREVIESHAGAFYLLTKRPDVPHADISLAPYRLELKPATCRPVPSRLDGDLVLCDVAQRPGGGREPPPRG